MSLPEGGKPGPTAAGSLGALPEPARPENGLAPQLLLLRRAGPPEGGALPSDPLAPWGWRGHAAAAVVPMRAGCPSTAAASRL